MHISIILILAISLIASFVSACVDSDTKYADFSSKIVNVEPGNAAIKHLVAGSVKIMSGCSFFVRNMTIIPSGNAVYWYGIPVKNNTDPYPRVVAAALGSYNGQSVTFTLDPQYSFSDFSIMEIRSEGDSRAYGAFSISGNIESYYNVKKGAVFDDNADPTDPFGHVNGGSSFAKPAVGLSFFVALFASFL